jgi:hypothetical protein
VEVIDKNRPFPLISPMQIAESRFSLFALAITLWAINNQDVFDDG